MQLVINIDEELYQICKDLLIPGDADPIERAIAGGTPLPKGHGDLIDRNEIEYLKAIHDLKWGRITANECAKKIKYSAPTIIEADKESEVSDGD